MKKALLEEIISQLEAAQEVKCNFDMNSLSMQLRLVFQEEINAITVGNTYRLLG